LTRGSEFLAALPGHVALEPDLVGRDDLAGVGDGQRHALIVQVFDEGHLVAVDAALEVGFAEIGLAVSGERLAGDVEGIGISLRAHLAVERRGPGAIDIGSWRSGDGRYR